MNLSPRARNFIAVLASNFGVQALRFLTITVLARRLGSVFFGAYNYILLLVTYGFIVTEFGLRNLGIREFAQNRGSRKLIKQIIKIRLFYALVAVGVVMGLTTLAFPSNIYFWPSLLISSSLFADAFFVDYILVAKEALVPQAMGNLSQASVLLAGCFFFIHSTDHFRLLGEFYFLSHVVWASIFFFTARKFWPKTYSTESDNRTWHTAMSGAPFMIALLATNFQNFMDLLLLGQFHYDDLLGTYSAALKIIGIALGLVFSLVVSVQPRLARESSNIHSLEMKNLVSATTRFLWVFIAPTIIGCWFFGDQLIGWIFGANYADAATYLKPLSLSFAFLSLSMAPLTTLMVSSQPKVMLKIVCTNCLVSFILIGGILFMHKPQWVPWGMVVVEALLMLTTWGWFGTKEIVTMEDLKLLPIPVILLTLPLFFPVAAPLRFCLAAAGYLLGLGLTRVWNRPWFSLVLGRTT